MGLEPMKPSLATMCDSHYAIPAKTGGCRRTRTYYLALIRRVRIRMCFATETRLPGRESNPSAPLLKTGRALPLCYQANWSERQDLNLRSCGPQPHGLPG